MTRLAMTRVRWLGRSGGTLLRLRFALTETMDMIELRVLVGGDRGWVASLPRLRRMEAGS